MFGGVVKPAGWATVLMAGGMMLGGSISAQAADFGGDCCADLEERIAELEATTARKGNRKVSLEVYGKVNQALMWWDDGGESNVYSVTNDASRTRFGFQGKAKITSDLEAGYRIEIGIRTANSKRDNQGDPLGETGFDIRHAWWSLKSKTFGKIQVGHTPTASQEITESNLAGTSDAGKFSDVEDSGGGFFLRSSGGLSNQQWRRLIARTGSAPGEGDRREAIYYVSPTYAGFSVSAGWGGDDFWDVGLRYEAELGSFEIESGIAYAEITDEIDDSATHGCPTNSESNCQMLGGSISIMEAKSGLYGNFAAGQIWDDNAELNVAGAIDDTYFFWAAEAGIQQKWISLGKTTIFAQYYDYDGGAIQRTFAGGDPTNPFAGSAQIASSEVRSWGIGVMQKLDAADMKLYALYRHYEFDMDLVETATGTIAASNALEDFDVLMTGAAIKF